MESLRHRVTVATRQHKLLAFHATVLDSVRLRQRQRDGNVSSAWVAGGLFTETPNMQNTTLASRELRLLLNVIGDSLVFT